MLTLSKLAAALLLAATGAYFAAGPHPAAATTFAEMARKLREAHTMTYRMSIETDPAVVKGPMRTRMYFKEPDRFRSESEGEGPTSVIDTALRKTLVLDPKTKTALILEDKGPKPAGPAPTPGLDLAASMRALEKAEGKPAGERQVGGVKARGFRVAQFPGQEMTFWVDPATDLPLLVESSMHTGGHDIRVTLTDIQLDRPLDDALFQTQPPEGYTTQTVAAENLSAAEVKTPEEAAVRLLKVYTEKSGGTFPPKLDDFNMFEKVLKNTRVKAGAPVDPEMLRMVTVMVRFQMAAQELKGHFGYKPDGARPGDASRVIFWYRPAGSATYRAVFADLHTADVAADKLPEAPKF